MHQGPLEEVFLCFLSGELGTTHGIPSKPGACHHLSLTTVRTGTGFAGPSLVTQKLRVSRPGSGLGYDTMKLHNPEPVGEPPPSYL